MRRLDLATQGRTTLRPRSGLLRKCDPRLQELSEYQMLTTSTEVIGKILTQKVNATSQACLQVSQRLLEVKVNTKVEKTSEPSLSAGIMLIIVFAKAD